MRWRKNDALQKRAVNQYGQARRKKSRNSSLEMMLSHSMSQNVVHLAESGEAMILTILN